MGPEMKWFLIGQCAGGLLLLAGLWVGRRGRG
jgi:hypothetical protein